MSKISGQDTAFKLGLRLSALIAWYAIREVQKDGDYLVETVC